MSSFLGDIDATYGGRVIVKVPYLPDFVAEARKLGGDFQRHTKLWIFNQHSAAGVKAALERCYGWDGVSDRPQVHTVHLSIPRLDAGETLCGLGRILMQRMGRDLPVRLHPTVGVVSGELPARGGSRQNPAIGLLENVTLAVDEVPATLAGIPVHGIPCNWP